MSRRETITADIVQILKAADDPRFGLVSREPFDVTQLSRQQFPAVYVTTADETRRDLTIRGKSGLREGRMEIVLTGWVNGAEVDRMRNDLIERVEEALDDDRTRDAVAYSTQVTEIAVDTNIVAPYGSVQITVEVVYNFQRGQS